MDSVFHDLRYAFRRLGRSPGFSVVAALTLALGIGANTALFSLANAVFVRPQPAVHGQSRLVWITPVYTPTGRPTQMAYPDFLDFRSESVFESAAAFGNAEFSLSGGAEPVRVRGQLVSGNLFAMLGVRMQLGRAFAPDEDDKPATAPVVVIEDFARRAWPGVNPLGRHISVRGEHGPFMTVIGVARTALTFGLGEQLRPIVYRPASQAPDERDMTLLVRSAGDATQLASAIRTAVRALDPNLPVYALQSLGAYRRARLSDMALGSSLLGGIGALAMLLATIGIYAVVSFSVGQRVREIGLRVALGAAGGDVTSMFLRGGARLTALGLGIGLALAGIAGRAVSTQFFGVSVMDAATFAIVAALLGCVALVATWIPARRAAAVDPMIALRAE